MRLALLGISVVLAFLTYRFIELPARSVPPSQARRLLFATGVAIRKMDGFKFRALSRLNGDVSTLTLGRDRDALRQECAIPEDRKREFRFCLSHGSEAPRFVVLGDSKAEALYFGLARESRPGMGGQLMGYVKPPRQDAAIGNPLDSNRLAFQAVLDNPSIKVVVFAGALRDIFQIDGDTGFIKGDAASAATGWLAAYGQAIRRIEGAGKRALFIIDNPTLPDPRSCISGGMTASPFLNRFLQRKPNPRCTIRYTDHLAGTAVYRGFVDDLAKANPGLVIYDPTPLLCDLSKNECSITRNGKFLYSYSDHISDYANSLIAHELLPAIEKLAQQQTSIALAQRPGGE